MRTYVYFQVCNAVDAFMGDHAGDFDRIALINVLFKEVPTHPECDSEFTEREYTDAEIQGCDVTQRVPTYVPTDSGETMLAERWFTSPEHGPVHVGAWEDGSGAVSLSLATVEGGGCCRGMVAVVSLRTRLSLKHGVSLTGLWFSQSLGVRPGHCRTHD